MRTPETEEEESLPFDAYMVTVTVNWLSGEKERQFDISTLRLMEKKTD
jgi:hypothetical protein